ncbi:uncharacterized protein BO66DRAFT_441815, partial [Aspergillus aculeatinus CBS 121060]
MRELTSLFYLYLGVHHKTYITIFKQSKPSSHGRSTLTHLTATPLPSLRSPPDFQMHQASDKDDDTVHFVISVITRLPIEGQIQLAGDNCSSHCFSIAAANVNATCPRVETALCLRTSVKNYEQDSGDQFKPNCCFYAVSSVKVYLHNWSNKVQDQIKANNYVIPATKSFPQRIENAKKFLNALKKEVQTDEEAKSRAKKRQHKDSDSDDEEFIRPPFDEEDKSFVTSMSFNNDKLDPSKLYTWMVDRHLIWKKPT